MENRRGGPPASLQTGTLSMRAATAISTAAARAAKSRSLKPRTDSRPVRRLCAANSWQRPSATRDSAAVSAGKAAAAAHASSADCYYDRGRPAAANYYCCYSQKLSSADLSADSPGWIMATLKSESARLHTSLQLLEFRIITNAGGGEDTAGRAGTNGVQLLGLGCGGGGGAFDPAGGGGNGGGGCRAGVVPLK